MIIITLTIIYFRSSDSDIELVPLDTFIKESPISEEDVVCELNNYKESLNVKMNYFILGKTTKWNN